ncbi:MAG: dimethyl sulfoxide reductase anchor subunit [Gammaproteobacteria bacterium]|nr:dimethyl sulfoxide reductase anchor subunit [Gammaproteobacteria bacterium]
MHPAFSVIFFTTASGAGYGLLALLGVFGALGVLPAERWFGVAAFGSGFALITAGLLSSTFHLGHPERAWRAMTQWRSSWLSREGVMAVLTYIPAGFHAAGWVYLERTDGVFAALGLAGAVLCLITVYCTAMIYAALNSIPRWANPFVPPAYLLLGLATGALLLMLLTHLFAVNTMPIDLTAALSVLFAAAVKLAYWSAIRRDGGSTAASATGLGKPGLVRLLDAPHTESNYLLQEMGCRVARKHAGRLRVISTLTLFAVPAALVLTIITWGAGPVATAMAATAVASAAIGVVTERWLFFAEAKHTVTLYYGAESV